MSKKSLERVSTFLIEARLRARRRKSAWNLILIPPALFGWLGSWYALFRIVWSFHQALYPQHAFHDFWQEGVGFQAFTFSFIMLFALFPAAICIGLIFANCAVWLIPPARRTLDEEAEGFEGTSFRESNQALLRLVKWAVPGGLIVALVAASLLKSLR
ncbi:MAG TPA: hypothetical protein VFI45_01465 [Candidatus Acidoferrum sp.]|nr:hypothetical protein [Candidatus Acidoferrum sp.]